MKKITFCLLVALASLTAGAQNTLESTATLWGKLLTTPYTTQGSSLCLSSDGSALYAVSGAGSKSTDEQVLLGDDVVASGTQYSGTSASGNQALVLNKIDASGTPLWTLFTTNGEVGSGAAFVTPADDGGVVALFKLHHTDGRTAEKPVIVDGKGAQHEIDWTLDEGTGRYYNGFVVKVSADGDIEWMKTIEVSHEPQPAGTGSYADYTPEAFYPYALEIDQEGNLFIAGNMRATITLDKADGTKATIEAHNVQEWTGDPQKSVGNLFVIKLDENGNYLRHIVTTGEATHEKVMDLAISNGNIYLYSMIIGKENATFALGEISHTATNALGGISVAKLDSELNVDYFTYVENEGSKALAIQMPGITVRGDHIWLTQKMGQATFSTVNGSAAITLTRDAVAFKARENDGTLLIAKNKGTNQTGYFAALEDNDGQVYFAAHGLNAPLSLEKCNSETLETLETAALHSNTSDAQAVVAKGNKLFAMTRAYGNVDISFINSDLTARGTKFSCMLSAYELPFVVAQDSPDESDFDVNGDGQVTAADVSAVYNIILGASTDYQDRADVNGDGQVTAADVSVLYSIILGAN